MSGLCRCCVVIGWPRRLTARRLAAAVDDLGALPADRHLVLHCKPRAYELRAKVSAYDATYVAQAEQLDCALVTADRRLASAPRPRCAITLMST